jgi:ABC-type transport system involved in multi-copper enzyme maturation permease subunit
MWIRLLKLRADNPLFVQARRRLRRRWWRSWGAPVLAVVLAFYGLLFMAYFDVGLGAQDPGSGLMAEQLLRLFLLSLCPLITLIGYVAGARAVQREREKGTLESLLLTDLSNYDLLAGKILGALLPFLLFVLLMVPAVIEFGTVESADVPTLFTRAWEFQDFLESLWYLPHWEMLVYILLGATLGVVYGVHRAANHRRSSMIYSAGAISFLIVIPFGMLFISALVQSLVELTVTILHSILLPSREQIVFTTFKPFARVLGMIIAAWVLTLIPLFELADQFRYLCGEERDPRELRFRRPLAGSPGPPPIPWAQEAAKPKNVWDDYEQRHQGRPRPRSAIARPPRERDDRRNW